jgi:hypothetical protein
LLTSPSSEGPPPNQRGLRPGRVELVDRLVLPEGMPQTRGEQFTEAGDGLLDAVAPDRTERTSCRDRWTSPFLRRVVRRRWTVQVIPHRPR